MTSSPWQPIETAPKDGTRFETGFGNPSEPVAPGKARIVDGALLQESWPHNGRILCMKPTLWRPTRKDTP